MPVKALSLILKPRNLRLIIITLTICTIILALYHLLYNQSLEPLSPSPTQRIINKYNVLSENENDNQDDFNIPEETLYNEPLKDNNNEGGCLKINPFKPDFDSQRVYPSFKFDADWIRGKDYWNSFFEKRYNEIKKAPETPYAKIFVIPHSHTDPGWLRTFEEYFYSQTKNIIDNAVEKLGQYSDMRFQFSEISFLSKWWDHAHKSKRDKLRTLVQNGNIEIATGGWVMTDEATVHLYSMIDQLIEGHQWVQQFLQVVPRSSWSVDPFGHGSTFPYILNRAGIKGMVIQRIHYAWKKWLAEKQLGDFKWVQRWDKNNKNSIVCHNAPFDIYSIKHSCGPTPSICLNFDFRNITGEYIENYMISVPITDKNVKEKSELLLEQYQKTASLFPHNVAMISLGDDFRFDKLQEWDQQYLNYMKLFTYINANRDVYKTEVGFGTISDYFKAVEERMEKYPTFSGDFFVYSDIFSEGRPAYWSGYFSTRPFWKKFYRETEAVLRSAEILFSYTAAWARQNSKDNVSKMLTHEYGNLVNARRDLALFAHHDATTGTSKVHTMNDYGNKLMDAMQNCIEIQMFCISTLLFKDQNINKLSTDYELSNFGSLPRKIPLLLVNQNGKDVIKRVVLFNNLGWKRSQYVKVVVTNPLVQVFDPKGQSIPSQLNPILDMNGSFMQTVISSEIFELTFIAELSPLSISTYSIKVAASANDNNVASPALVFCRNCTIKEKIFEISRIQPGDIQLNNDRLQLLFDRNTGFLLNIKHLQREDLNAEVKMTFGGYSSMDWKSGAYLMMIDSRANEQKIPFSSIEPKIFIISGSISSEISVFARPLIVSSRIMHKGGKEFEEAIFIHNEIDLERHNAEVFMRFDTDLQSLSRLNPLEESSNEAADVPTFFTDQSGYTMEKRQKISQIKIEGNYYPVTTMSYVQDFNDGRRFTVLVDRAHGFSSLENGRIETQIERRTAFDDARGMGEGVTDNRATISNYVIFLEKVNIDSEKYDSSLPTLTAHHLSQALNYPASLFVYDENMQNTEENPSSNEIQSLLTKELPADSHLLIFRTLSQTNISNNFDINFPSERILLIMQRLGYACSSPMASELEKNCQSLQTRSLFKPESEFIGIKIGHFRESTLTGIQRTKDIRNYTQLEKITGEPFDIKAFILEF